MNCQWFTHRQDVVRVQGLWQSHLTACKHVAESHVLSHLDHPLSPLPHSVRDLYPTSVKQFMKIWQRLTGNCYMNPQNIYALPSAIVFMLLLLVKHNLTHIETWYSYQIVLLAIIWQPQTHSLQGYRYMGYRYMVYRLGSRARMQEGSLLGATRWQLMQGCQYQEYFWEQRGSAALLCSLISAVESLSKATGIASGQATWTLKNQIKHTIWSSCLAASVGHSIPCPAQCETQSFCGMHWAQPSANKSLQSLHRCSSN